MADDVKTRDSLTRKLVDWFEASEETTNDSRQRSQRARDYVDDKQWTNDEIAKLEDRGQPALSFNFIKPKVNFITGFETQSRSDPKAFPRNQGADEEASEAATDAIRFVQDKEDLPDKFADTFDNMLVEGFGGVEVLVDEKSEINVKWWAWDRLFYDPHSSRADFSDAKYLGGVVWMDAEDAQDKYPDAKEAVSLTLASSPEEDKSEARTYDDKPRNWKVWATLGKRNRIRVVQIYWKERGRWMFAHYTKGGILLGPMVVPFTDGEGGNECPLILESAYVDRDNNRYGEVQAWIDVQDEYNKRRSRLLYEALAKQVISDKGAVDNVDQARKQMARPDGWIEKNIGREFKMVEQGNSLNVQASLLELARNDMQQMGPSATLQGDAGQQASGRAIIASQQGGIVELGRLMSRYRRLRLRTYRQIWNRIRQFWTAERWIRVTDDEQNVRFVGLNRPVTALEELQKQSKDFDDGNVPPEMVAALEQMEANPELAQKPVRIENVPAEMDMDIILDETPDVVTLQQEQFSEIMALAQSGAVQFSEEEIIMLSQLKNKDKFLEARQKREEEGEMSPQMQLQMEGLIAEVLEQRAKADKTAAEAEKASAETQQIQVETAVGVASIQ